MGLKFYVTAFFFAAMVYAAPARSEGLVLPEPLVPTIFKPYLDENFVKSNVRTVLEQLRSAELSPVFPIRDLPQYGPYIAPGPEVNFKRSPCNDDQEAMSIHKGLAWISIAYRLFAGLQEGPAPSVSTDLANRSIAGPGRVTILRGGNLATYAALLVTSLDEQDLPLSSQKDIAAFINTLIDFKGHFDRLLSTHENISSLLANDRYTHITDKENALSALADRLDALTSDRQKTINRCLLGYADYSASVGVSQEIHSGAIYSKGIVMYAIGFWQRREREGTSLMAETALRYVTSRLK
jgi:hypothetical protein